MARPGAAFPPWALAGSIWEFYCLFHSRPSVGLPCADLCWPPSYPPIGLQLKVFSTHYCVMFSKHILEWLIALVSSNGVKTVKTVNVIKTLDFIIIYKLLIWSCLEYNAVSFQSSLSSQQAAALAGCFFKIPSFLWSCPRAVFPEPWKYMQTCDSKAAPTSLNKIMFPLNPNLNNQQSVRKREKIIKLTMLTRIVIKKYHSLLQRLLNNEEKPRAVHYIRWRVSWAEQLQ